MVVRNLAKPKCKKLRKCLKSSQKKFGNRINMGKTLSLTAVATVIERLSFNDMAMRNSEKRSTMTNATLLFWVDMGNCSKSMATNSNG